MADVSTAERGQEPRAAHASVDLAHALAPLAIAVPAFVAIATMVGRTLSVSRPDLGFVSTANGDAEAFYLGEPIDRDPADGFTGQVITPLFPFLISLLHRVHHWGGWLPLVNYAATLVLIGLAAWLAFDRRALGARRLAALLGAAAMGIFAWWLVSVLPVNVLYEGRADHTAWAFAMGGLVLLAARPDGPPWVLAAAVVLLSAAIWTKQTTVVAAAAAAAWMLAAALLGAVGWRRALALCAGLAALNLTVLGLLNLATDGWEYFFDFELAREHPEFADYWPSFREFLRYVAIAVAFPVVLAVGLAVQTKAWRRAVRGSPASLRVAAGAWLVRSRDARLATLLALFVLVSGPAAVYFRLKVGAEPNHYVGVLWGVGLLSAIAWRASAAYRGTALLAAGAVLVLFLLAQRPGNTVQGYWVAPLHRTQEYAELPADLVEYARSHLVWHQVHSDLNVEPQGSIYPNFYNVVDLLSAGEQPLYLVDALLDRRFDAVAPIRFPPGPVRTYWDLYASGALEEEQNYIWKLNEVIRAGYRPAPGPPAGFLARDPGGSRAPWMRDCFGPFAAAGVEFGIRRGGGFWCREGPGVLRLRRTPAPVSEIHALDTVQAVSGTLLLDTKSEVAVTLRSGDDRGWAMSVRPGPADRVRIDASSDGRPLGEPIELRLRDGRLRISFERAAPASGGLTPAGDGVRASLPEVDSGDLSIGAARDSRARVDLSRLELDR